MFVQLSDFDGFDVVDFKTREIVATVTNPGEPVSLVGASPWCPFPWDRRFSGQQDALGEQFGSGRSFHLLAPGS